MGEFVAVAFIIISIIGWVINQVNQNKPAAPRGVPRRRDRRIQEEIDDFLREATGGRKPPERVLRADEIEIIEERPAPRRPAPSRSQPRSRPGSGVSSRHLSDQQQFGSSVREHLRSHMDQRVQEEATAHLPHAVNQLVTQHLGAFSAETGSSSGRTAQADTRRRAAVPAAALRAAFLTRGGIRNAVLMQEILRRPRSLQDRR